MKLIPNISQSWRMWSVQLLAVIALVQGVWLSLPADARSALPQDTVYWVTLALSIAAQVARVIKQNLDQATGAEE